MPADLRATDLWTLRTPDDRLVRATLLPRGFEVALVWFVDGKVEGVEDFQDWEAALRQASCGSRLRRGGSRRARIPIGG